MDYADYVDALKSDHPDLAKEFAPFHTLENVLAWMRGRGLPLGSLEIITQDEFSHDVLIPLERAGRYVVFGSS